MSLLLILLIFISLPTQAADAGLEEVLGGFEEPQAVEPTLDEVMEGFDEGRQEEGGDVESVLEGFEEGRTVPAVVTHEESSSPWEWSGAVILSTSYNFDHDDPAPGAPDYRGFSRLRAKLDLELDYGFSADWKLHAEGHAFNDFIYELREDNNYPDKVIDIYEDEVVLDEYYLQGRLSDCLDIKLGRQIVVWGKSDNLRVTDILNPMDFREIGMVDIEDLRRPLTMLRLDGYHGDWRVTGLVIPEIRFNKNAPFGSDFYPRKLPPPPEQTPRDGGSNTEYALAVNGIFSGWDIAFYAARLFDDQPHNETVGDGTTRRHSRITMGGMAANVATGNWLLKAEAAHLSGLEFTTLPGKERSRSDLLLGVEYAGFTDASLSFEVVDRHLHRHDSRLRAGGTKQDEFQTAIRFQGDYLFDRLHLTLLNSLNRRGRGGGFTRTTLAYDLEDALTLTGGVVFYHGGHKVPFNAIGDNDRLFLELKHSF